MRGQLDQAMQMVRQNYPAVDDKKHDVGVPTSSSRTQHIDVPHQQVVVMAPQKINAKEKNRCRLGTKRDDNQAWDSIRLLQIRRNALRLLRPTRANKSVLIF